MFSRWPPRICRETLGTCAPVDYLRLIDLVTRVGGGGQARGVADGTVDVDRFSARATDQVVVVVPDTILVEGRRPGGLDAPDETLLGQHLKGVVTLVVPEAMFLTPRFDFVSGLYYRISYTVASVASHPEPFFPTR